MLRPNDLKSNDGYDFKNVLQDAFMTQPKNILKLHSIDQDVVNKYHKK